MYGTIFLEQLRTCFIYGRGKYFPICALDIFNIENDSSEVMLWAGSTFLFFNLMFGN